MKGGACGYENAVAQAPFSSMVSAGGPSLYKSGKGCGACYQIKCTSKPACSTNPVTVVITDECKGCVTESVHFDLSGTAFGALASSGQDSQLRDVGVLQILYRKVECNYIGETVTFHVENGSNPYSFAALIEYEDGDGEIGLVELKQALDSDTWLPMSQSWGAVWKLDVTSPLRAPLSLRLTNLDSGETVVASDVIPAGWEPGEKVECNYIGETVTFHVENGSNPYSFAALIEYEDGDGEIGLVELKQALDSDTWLPMSQSWGAVWKLDVTSPLRAPLSLRLTNLDSGETVVASDVIPAGWEPGEKYKSNVNFQV
ncbi:hypothetical protein F2Q69_00010714 [Brassica cretica]|uniref:Expansin-B2 n=1 Tax=Brassica cretica TaxID=69181 RepID=A0A8S9R4Q5_BRACR|nr:hypothetical protein F2Q69_00010714 [Brassica cretica]